MDFTYSDEQTALGGAVRDLMRATYSSHADRLRVTQTEPGFDPKVWARMANMGLLGLPFDEEVGGGAAGAAEVSQVCQELGRANAPEPYLTSVVLAGGLVAALATASQKQDVLTSLAAGERILAFAHDEPNQSWSPSAARVHAVPHDGRWQLSGVKEPVQHGARADLLVVSALYCDGGTGLFLVDGQAADRAGYRTYDGSRAARVTLASTVATPLGPPGRDLTEEIAAVQDICRIMAANEALGAMQFCLHTTTDYLKSRKQFGSTLSSFQSLRFRAADMFVAIELTRSLVDWATMVAGEGNPRATAVAAHRVSLQVSRAGRLIGQESIQLHGAIGMTEEYSIGHYVAHLTVLDHLLGDGNHHVGRLAADVLDHDALEPMSEPT